MKHILIAGLSLFTLSLFSSCDKDYTCACTYAGFSDKNFEVKLESMRHNDAKVMCRDYATFVDSTSFYDISCELK
jgi:hypothetical protein